MPKKRQKMHDNDNDNDDDDDDEIHRQESDLYSLDIEPYTTEIDHSLTSREVDYIHAALTDGEPPIISSSSSSNSSSPLLFSHHEETLRALSVQYLTDTITELSSVIVSRSYKNASNYTGVTKRERADGKFIFSAELKERIGEKIIHRMSITVDSAELAAIAYLYAKFKVALEEEHTAGAKDDNFAIILVKENREFIAGKFKILSENDNVYKKMFAKIDEKLAASKIIQNSESAASKPNAARKT